MTTITNDGLLAVSERLGVQTLPVALAVAPRQDSYDEWMVAQRRVTAELTRSGVIDAHGEVEPDLADALHILAQPDRELAARVYGTTSGVRRICLARRGGAHALAVRTEDGFDVQPVWADGGGQPLVRALLAILGPGRPAEVVAFSALSSELSERLAAALDSADYADAVYALGVADRDATAYGMAFAACHTYAEIVAEVHEDGTTTRSPGAVAVYDTGRGRIVAAPGIAPDQQVWSTVTPGTDHRIAQAVSALIETLPVGRWLL
ncbi:ESX secretion-associated protein EspG [Nocardia bovistercoris]|uniref:ESX secretion-associated protein EspG n=1 Tax=Nocardia bovistercoris TaxID=2785916 RepID=A0A931IBR0_9NOCA|nr:ESX secretion-associated protein EspG [Nocardia bovistercoris]MBH0777583.1 ESX secretion-associated protein EspG [Nocardia bovistercoris]